jgi:hypothetical protein
MLSCEHRSQIASKAANHAGASHRRHAMRTIVRIPMLPLGSIPLSI